MSVKTPAGKASVVFGNLPIDIQRALRAMQTSIDQLQATVEAQAQQIAGKVGSSQSDLLGVSHFVKTQLQANGQTPLSIASLPGVTAQPQKALVPSYGSSPVGVAGTVVYQNGQLYRSDGVNWIAVTSGGVLYDTHAHRGNYSAGGYAPGTMYFETDRAAFYLTNGSVWSYGAGVMVAVIASRPSDLGSTDQGFQFLASDTLNAYEWSGSTWVLISNGASLTTGNLTETGSAVLTVTGGTGAVLGTGAAIQVKQASGTVNGYLSSADWATFNAKQASLGYTPLNPANNLSEVTAATARTNLSVPGLTTANTYTGTQQFNQSITLSLSLKAAMLSTAFRVVSTATDTASVNTDHTLALTGVTTESLPASPVAGHEFFVINIGAAAATLSGNGHNIWVAGVSAASITLAPGASVILKYDLTNTIWRQVGALLQASASQSGYLSSTDWSTFSAKQAALTLGNFTESTSAILTITGGTAAIIGSGLSVQVKQSSAAQSGYLSSADWSTFNGKQSNLGFTPLNPANNLSDVSLASSARTNLGVGFAWLTYAAVPPTGNGAMTLSAVTYIVYKYFIIGNFCYVTIRVEYTIGGTPNNILFVPVPQAPAFSYPAFACVLSDNGGAYVSATAIINGTSIQVSKSGGAVYTAGAGALMISGFYGI